ncbi:protein WHAT'S THIS FACTOR 9, mitochondrial [Abrus precatorius]|uniref:Protein WHAT'S THIS FACTOR 9, mitochondrial n=1 Tax=Abrus precatorius TaxID=3816 RepID=A0A8B8MGG6_ABRPR|nr:protein WHAT'S THIS FACTOR 9, mitochondrial [Abrus precatorius]
MHQQKATRMVILFSRTKRIPNQARSRQGHLRTIFDGTLKAIRDRGLDHAVERERNLKGLLTLKDLIKREPSKSLPVSLIKHSFNLPFRPIAFIRRYPSVFEEFVPCGIHPHVRLTPQTLSLDAEEQLMHQTDRFKQHVADRLLKLLMIARVHKIPLRVIELLKWDLALPHNYVETVIPEFPDCFRIVDEFLELVCWSHELAVSVLQKNGKGNEDLELVFPVQFSNGFEMDNKYEKWLREWQRLPYVSPYENLSCLSGSSDESDRWVVGVLHEILNVFVGKKIEKDNLLVFGEWLGLRSRFKRALLQHPGIFYVSGKIGTYTVVLREGYKRGSLIEDDPVMNLRNQYVHLMNSVKEDGKVRKVVQEKGSVNESDANGVEGMEGEGTGDADSGEEHEEEDCEVEDAGESVVDDDEERSRRGSCKIASGRRGRGFGKVKLDVEMPLRSSQGERLMRKLTQKTREKSPSEVSRRKQVQGAHKDIESTQRRSRSSKGSGRSLTGKKTPVL